MRQRIGVIALGVVLGDLGFQPRRGQSPRHRWQPIFPTLATDDPFAVDELALPEITYVRNGGPSSRELDTGFEFDKEIFPGFALGISDTYISQKGVRQNPSAYGWANLDLTAKYQRLAKR